MDVTRKDIDQLNAELTLKVTPADYQDKVDAVLKEHRKKATIPGFRKGMVPMGVIKKQVGISVLVDEINKLLSDELYKYISENKIDMLGNPIPKQQDRIDFATQTEFEFTYEIGIAPQFEVEVSDKHKFEKVIVKIDDKLIDQNVNEIAKRYGKMENADVSAEDDMLYGKFVELNEKGEVKEAGIYNSSVLNIVSIADKSIVKKLTGLKPGDTVVVNPAKMGGANYIKSWLGIDETQAAAIDGDFNFIVEKINRMVPADLNQEFFDKLYGKDVVTSEEQFRDKIKEELEKSFSQNSDQLLNREVQDTLIEKTKIELPDEFLKRWLMVANEKPVTKEQIESEYDQYAVGLRWQLIENKIIKDNKLEVSRDEVVDYTKSLIQQQMAGMGQNFMDDAELTDTANRVLQNQDEARQIYEQLYQQKLIQLYNNNFKIKEKSVTYDEFVKLAESKRK
ncbi:trigger factor [bacterium]|nr:trigger factor [bacterium]